MKLTAWSILSVIVIPVLGWAGSTLFDHSQRITRVEEKEKSIKEILVEIKCDVKTLKGERCPNLSP